MAVRHVAWRIERWMENGSFSMGKQKKANYRNYRLPPGTVSQLKLKIRANCALYFEFGRRENRRAPLLLTIL